MNGRHRAALLVVDLQSDFCAGGALPVPDADQVVNAMNRYISDAVGRGVTVYASRDWHPPVSSHFKTFGGPWPTHCVQGTDGARFHPNLCLPSTGITITKGERPDSSGYSAFEGHTPEGKPFLADLQERGIRHLYIGGLATDYCVRCSVLDALSAGLGVTVLEDAIAGVDAVGTRRAIAEFRERGAQVVTGSDLSSVPVESERRRGHVESEDHSLSLHDDRAHA
jgi:nicotinamidase/pyrazinamidase